VGLGGEDLAHPPQRGQEDREGELAVQCSLVGSRRILGRIRY
jgi:hypothetical protein